MTLKLGGRAAEYRRLHRCAAPVAVWQEDGLVVGSAARLVAGVAAVRHVVALPPEGDALLATALEHPLVAVAAREVGRRRNQGDSACREGY